jgi:hypothetical protein
MKRYRLSDKEVMDIEKAFHDEVIQEQMKKEILQDKIDWVEAHIPDNPPLADGGDVSLDEIRRDLEEQIGLIVLDELDIEIVEA